MMLLLGLVAAAVVLWVLTSFVVAFVVGRMLSGRVAAALPAEVGYPSVTLPRAS